MTLCCTSPVINRPQFRKIKQSKCTKTAREKSHSTHSLTVPSGAAGAAIILGGGGGRQFPGALFRGCERGLRSRSVADCRPTRRQNPSNERFALSSHAAVIIRCCHFSDNENTHTRTCVCLHSGLVTFGVSVQRRFSLPPSASVFQNSHLFFLHWVSPPTCDVRRRRLL